ncbi:heat-shock protein Hsp20 [Streptomyces caelestis]|uniref:Heat-shock protein Hsp20 n=2 Tax=Streptomyces TaxID=1883 RepID=A0A0M8QPB8_9ACTN|nr:MULTISPECIES: Hsp20/alpha crystallin family protein [Streptomyces]KOT42660.1 heat-shock protein Hsp20 [Streptomyces caelestis]KOV30021.1 heat-shock protein Hsp20 [Streptomyces sp. XY152]
MTHPVRHSRSGLPAALHELDDLRTRMDQLMHAVFPIGGPLEFGAGEPWAPLADVVDAEDAYLVELDLPGVDKDQVTVEVAEGELGIHGEIEEKEHAGVVRRHSRRTGRFDYRTTLPPNSDTEHVSADLTSGVLTVRVPKTETGKAHRVEITG